MGCGVYWMHPSSATLLAKSFIAGQGFVICADLKRLVFSLLHRVPPMPRERQRRDRVLLVRVKGEVLGIARKPKAWAVGRAGEVAMRTSANLLANGHIPAYKPRFYQRVRLKWHAESRLKLRP